MIKKLKIIIMSVILMSLFIIKVSAAEKLVSNEQELRDCISSAGNTAETGAVCKLTKDISIKSTINIINGSHVTIDLGDEDNSFNIDQEIPDSTLFRILRGIAIVKGHGSMNSKYTVFEIEGNTIAIGNAIKSELEIGSNVNLISEKDNCVYIKGNGAKVDIYGSLESKGLYATIQGQGIKNGTIDNGRTKINIYSGARIINNISTAIYHPQSGELNIYGGTITGTTGIEMRSGVLSVEGGTITGAAIPSSSTANGSGSTTIGAGIAIVQHTTEQDLELQINGGIIKGYTALLQKNVERLDKSVIEKIIINISGGTFETINGGTVAVESENITEFISGGTFSSSVEKEYLVTGIKLEKNEDGSFAAKNYHLIFIDENIKNGKVTTQQTAYEGDLVKLDIKADEGYKIASIEVLDHLDRKVDVKDNEFTMPNSPVFVKVSFVKEEEVPNTGDNIVTFIIIGLMSLIAFGYAANKLRKNA